MTKQKTIILSPTSNLLHAKALAIRIQLLEQAWVNTPADDEMQNHLILLELGTAYKKLMSYEDSTKTFLQTAKVS